MARDGYHIHTILNSKALPKLEDQMTLAAAAVPLTLTHFTVAVQCSKPYKCNLFNFNSKLMFWGFFKDPISKSSVLFCSEQDLVSFPDPESTQKWSLSPCRTLIHEIMGLFLSQGEPPGLGRVYFGSQPTVLETRSRDRRR